MDGLDERRGRRLRARRCAARRRQGRHELRRHFKTWTKVAVPAAEAGLVYNGSEQVGVASGTGYALSGVAAATDAGSYTATATRSDPANTVWADDESAPSASASRTIPWSIARSQATVTANDASKIAGNPDPTPFKTTVTGVVNDETLDYSVTRVAGEAAGTYDINVTLGSNPNYDVTAVKGTFTITGAAAMAISVADAGTGETTTNYFATVQTAIDSAAGAEPAVESVVLLADATETVVVSNAVALVLGGKTLTVVAGAIAAVDATEYDTIAEAVAAAGKTADGKVVTMLDDADAAVVLAFGDVLKIEHDDFDVQVGVSDADAARYHVTATDLKAARWDVVSGTSTLWKELGENAEIRVDSLDTTSSPVRFFRIAVTPYALSASDSVTFGKSE